MRDSFRAFQTSFLCLSVPLSVSRNEPAAAIKPGAPGEERRPPAAQWRPVNTIQQVRTAFTVVLNPDCEVRATGAVVSPCNSSDQKLIHLFRTPLLGFSLTVEEAQVLHFCRNSQGQNKFSDKGDAF